MGWSCDLWPPGGPCCCNVYCTTYCNKGHDTRDGAPIDHECYVLPPEALDLERRGDVPGAIKAIEAAKAKGPLRVHRGRKFTTSPKWPSPED